MLIVKSPYIKGGGKEKASGFMKYIATRDGVEKLPAHGYMKYIGTRPGAEKLGKHGLFGDEDNINLEQAMAELDSYSGNIWTHILSLKRADAERLGYNNALAWRNLLQTHRNQIAEAMHIPLHNFRWYAAYHDQDEHPHVHMMAWSSNPKEGYLNQDGIYQIRSELTNDIFKQEMLHIYERKSQSRDDLVREARKAMLDLTEAMQNGVADYPETEQLLRQLAQALETVKGKKSYGYLKKPLKELVDKIVEQVESFQVVAQCYEQWQILQGEVEGYYSDKDYRRKPLAQEKTFSSLKNIIIREADNLRLGGLSFEDNSAEIEQDDEMWQEYPYRELKQIIENSSYTLESRDQAVAEMEQLADAGDCYAQYFMGKLYREGGIVIPDVEQAVYSFEQAAEQGLGVAQLALGKLLISDDKLVRDEENGFAWLEAALENGVSHAGYLLAKEYLKGEIIEQDNKKALGFLQSSAVMGDQYAQYLLGKLLHRGKEVVQDTEQASYWLEKSAEQGNICAELYLDRLENGYAPSLMIAATRLLYQIGKLFRDNSLPQKEPIGMRIDKKQRQRIREKKLALGHKGFEHEQQQQQQQQYPGYL